MSFLVQVYIDDGRVFEYEVATASSAREHTNEIAMGGYRHNDGRGLFEVYPAHRINKIKVTGDLVPTAYPDKVRGT